MIMDLSLVQLLLCGCVGVSLSAACGFRVFVPLLVLSVAVKFFGFPVTGGFAWIGTWTALVVLSTATICEVLAYYIPWIDNALDVVNAPLAFVAGTIVMFGLLPESQPCLKWCLAAVIGGGAAETVHATTAVARAASSATTGGVGNNIVSSGENVYATGVSIMAIVAPVITSLILVIAIAIGVVVLRKLIRKIRRKRNSSFLTIPAKG